MTKAQKEKIILGYMKNLKIDRAEAEQLFEDDANDFITDQRRYEPSEKNKKKRTVKKDPEKIKLIAVLADFLSAEGLNPEIKNPQREIAFGDYSLTLTKHRKPKE